MIVAHETLLFLIHICGYYSYLFFRIWPHVEGLIMLLILMDLDISHMVLLNKKYVASLISQSYYNI